MGIIGWTFKKAVSTAATKSVIKAAAGAAVETVDSVSKAKAQNDARAEARARREAANEDETAKRPETKITERIVYLPHATLPEGGTTLQNKQIVCSQCGAVLRVTDGRQFIFCEFCGAQNDSEKQWRVAETSRIRELETEIESLKEALQESKRELYDTRKELNDAKFEASEAKRQAAEKKGSRIASFAKGFFIVLACILGFRVFAYIMTLMQDL